MFVPIARGFNRGKHITGIAFCNLPTVETVGYGCACLLPAVSNLGNILSVLRFAIYQRLKPLVMDVHAYCPRFQPWETYYKNN
jgi:hypothetical protein